jgi:uncharacterized membrane protein (DUF2068 family)
VGVFKLAKCVLLVVVGLGVISLLGRDASATIAEWATSLRVDPNDRVVHYVIAHLTGVSARKLESLGVGTLAYAAVFGVEGFGLLLEKPWAEYVTFFVTLSFLPLEVYELVRRASAARIGALALNVAVVVYLGALLIERRSGRRRKEPAS